MVLTQRVDCPICNAGAFGVKWVRDFYENRCDIKDLADHFTMSIQEVQDHLNSHDIVVSVNTSPKGVEKRDLSSPDFVINELLTMYTLLHDCVEDIKENETDSIKIDQLAKLNKEIRETLKFITDYQGKTGKTSESETRIINIEGNFNMLVNIIAGGDLCVKCQEKILRHLEDPKYTAMIE